MVWWYSPSWRGSHCSKEVMSYWICSQEAAERNVSSSFSPIFCIVFWPSHAAHIQGRSSLFSSLCRNTLTQISRVSPKPTKLAIKITAVTPEGVRAWRSLGAPSPSKLTCVLSSVVDRLNVIKQSITEGLLMSSLASAHLRTRSHTCIYTHTHTHTHLRRVYFS